MTSQRPFIVRRSAAQSAGLVLVFGWLALSSDEYAEALQDAADLGIVGGDIYDAMRVPYWFFTQRLRVVALTTIQ